MAFSVAWAKWQNSTVCTRWLPEGARQAGFTVVRVRPAARPLFLELVELLRLYGRLMVGRDKLPPQLDQAMLLWQAHTAQLVDVLRAGGGDE